MARNLPKIREFTELSDEAIRNDVIASGRPAVLRGLVRSWPAVKHALESRDEIVSYLRGLDNGTPVDAIMTAPEERGRVFYNAAMSGFNFVRNRLPLSTVAEQVLRYSAFPNPPAVAVQSALIRDCAPDFAAQNRLSFLSADVLPRIWLGNAITTPAHFDEWNNVGCVVSGRRRFTLFPPGQISNLYVGPLDFAPTGAPMSLVHVADPDFERYPRFRAALAAAEIAELGPGDAIFVPPAWWHHVESLEPFNLLVNYWWHAAAATTGRTDSAFECLMHSILNLRHLPPETRAAWGAIYAHYVFGSDTDVTAHIPSERQGLLGDLSAERARALRADLVNRLTKG